MSYRIELGPVSSPNQTLTSSDIISVDIAKPHTALADFEAEIPYSRSITDRVLDRVRIYANGTLLFRGYLRELDWDQDRGITRINGPGIADDLRDSAIERSFQNVATHDAIQQVWNDNTGFNATVTAPDQSVITEGEVLFDATTTAELDAEIDGLSNAPIVAKNGNIELAQSCFISTDNLAAGTRGEDQASGQVGGLGNGNVEIGTLGVSTGNAGDKLEGSFDLDYDIPADNVGYFFRAFPYDDNGDGATDDLPGFNMEIDGTVVYAKGDKWSLGSNVAEPGEPWLNYGGFTIDGGLSAGSHTVEIIQNFDSDDTYDELGFGIFGVYDDRFSYNFDNGPVSNSGDGSEGTYNYLEGPELYPASYTFEGDQYTLNQNVVGAKLTTGGWNDEGNGQAIGLSLDGGSTWTTKTGTFLEIDNQSNVGSTVNWRATLKRFGSGQERTPNQGYQAHKFGSASLTYDGSDLSIIPDDTFRGSPFRILADLHGRAGMRFVIDHAATDGSGNLTKAAESFPRGGKSKPKDWTVKNRRPSMSFVKYANEVTIYGALSGGTRPKVTVQDDDEVAAWGTEPYFEIRPDLDTVEQVRQAAIDTLSSKVKERDQSGDLSVLPTDVLPGYSYPVDWFADGTTTDTPLERVQFNESADQMRGTLRFKTPDDVTTTVIDQGRAIGVTREGI